MCVSSLILSQETNESSVRGVSNKERANESGLWIISSWRKYDLRLLNIFIVFNRLSTKSGLVEREVKSYNI